MVAKRQNGNGANFAHRDPVCVQPFDARVVCGHGRAMGAMVEIPLWLAILAGLLGFAGLLDRIIGPSLRWLIRKRLNRGITRLNAQLDLKIPSFKLTQRKVLIDRLVHDPQVMAAMEAAVAEEDMPRDVALEKVERYARETVPAFSPVMYFSFGMRVARWISERLYRVRVGVYQKPELDAIDREAAVVFVMNHRSNIDYLLVTYSNGCGGRRQPGDVPRGRTHPRWTVKARKAGLALLYVRGVSARYFPRCGVRARGPEL